jgi:hypothetical protein
MSVARIDVLVATMDAEMEFAVDVRTSLHTPLHSMLMHCAAIAAQDHGRGAVRPGCAHAGIARSVVLRPVLRRLQGPHAVAQATQEGVCQVRVVW